MTRTRPNILLLVLDGVRARNTSLNGYRRETTPRIERFAARATNYSRAYSPSTESLASHTSIFTGTHVREHGLTTSTGVMTKNPDATGLTLNPKMTMWYRLSNRGYATGVFSSNPFLTELPTGIPASFETVVGRQQELPFPNGLHPNTYSDAGPVAFLRDALSNPGTIKSFLNSVAYKSGYGFDSSAKLYVDQFLRWERSQNGPWAACLNFMDTHQTYHPGPETRWSDSALLARLRSVDDPVWEFVGGDRSLEELQKYEAIYDDAIRYVDCQIGRLLETLEAKDTLDNTMVIITSDHGEGFGETCPLRPDIPIVGHSSGGLVEDLARVPLLIRLPGQRTSRTISELASLTPLPDLVESVVKQYPSPGEAAGTLVSDEEVLVSTDGVSPHVRETVSEYVGQEELNVRSMPVDAVYTGPDGETQTYIVWGSVAGRIDDSGFLEDICSETDARSRVEATLDRLTDQDVVLTTDQSVSESVQNRLQDLGYV